ncbi:MAG TPA: LolA-related protein [Lysobacter sp.]|nr:LolA-related protein [Lysobacter sp.]
MLALATLSPAAPPPDAVHADWILAKLARPTPDRTAFVELRGSALLKAPLRIEGEYRRPRRDLLVREVRAPYRETTTIDTGPAAQVTLQRAGKPPRTFALARVPELASLQSSFGALLDGDRARLEQHYRIMVDGTRARWIMTLTPKHAQLAAKVRGIALHGRGAELRCIETTPAPVRGRAPEVQRTLLAGAAEAARGAVDAAALAALCRG